MLPTQQKGFLLLRAFQAVEAQGGAVHWAPLGSGGAAHIGRHGAGGSTGASLEPQGIKCLPYAILQLLLDYSPGLRPNRCTVKYEVLAQDSCWLHKGSQFPSVMCSHCIE